MKDAEWIAKGTTSFPRWDGRTFTVIPASSVFYAMYNPKILVEEYGHSAQLINYMTDFLANSFGYKSHLLENVTVKLYPVSSDYKRDLKAAVSSDEEEGLFYTVTLMNTLFPRTKQELPTKEDVLIEARNWRVLDYRCGCGRGETVDEYCSMPSDYVSRWGISLEEFNRSFSDEGVSKFYGKVTCKHVMRGVFETGRYFVLDMDEFQSRLPRMMRALSDASKEDEKLKQEKMDIALNPLIREMGFGDLLDYYEQLYKTRLELEPIEERLVRKLGKPRARRL